MGFNSAFKGLIRIYSDKHTKHINYLCGHNAEIFVFKTHNNSASNDLRKTHSTSLQN